MINVFEIKKLGPVSASMLKKGLFEDDRLVGMISLVEGASFPTYLSLRAKVSDILYTTIFQAKDLITMDADPNIKSIGLTERTTFGYAGAGRLDPIGWDDPTRFEG